MERLLSYPVPTNTHFEDYHVDDLIWYIQPKWDKYNVDDISETEFQNLAMAMQVYEKKGGDISYFTVGHGAPPSECTLC